MKRKVLQSRYGIFQLVSHFTLISNSDSNSTFGQKNWMIKQNYLSLFHHLRLRNLVIHKKPICKKIIVPNIYSKLLGNCGNQNWWRNSKEIHSFSSFEALHKCTITMYRLLRYEFYIKVDEKAHKVAILICRIIM